MPARFVGSSTAIANLALRHLAVAKSIVSLTEDSANASTCAAFFDTTRDEVLREFHWPFARRFATLILVGGTPTVPVTMDFQYSYRMPADCLKARRIQVGTRLDVRQTRAVFSVGGDATGGLIYTDYPVIAATTSTPQQPFFEYTAEVVDERLFAADFCQALAFKLAFYIAPAISQGGDSGKLGQRAFQLYQATLAQAEANALNEQQPDPAPESEFVLTRDR